MDNRPLLVILWVALSWTLMISSATATTTNSMTTAVVTTNSMPTAEVTNSMTTAVVTINSMTTAEVTNSMTTAEVTTNSMTTAEVTTNSMTTAEVTTNSMTTAEVTTNSMPTAEVTTNSMTTAEVTTNSMPTAEVTTNSMPTAEVTTNSMPTAEVTTNSMTTAEVTTNSMTTAEVTTNSMTSAEVTTNSMPTAEVTTNSMTSAPTLTVNTTVETLETPVSRTGCGTQQLCASEPSECDPSTGGSCFFFAAKQQQGSQNFEFSLSGESEGFIAATVSPDATVGDNDPTYVCANNNSVVQFFSTVLVNGSLTHKELSVDSVKGKVNGNKIQCTFTATVPSSRSKSSVSSAVSISTGTFNSISGTLGPPTTKFKSGVVNLSDPNSTVLNLLSTITTTSAPTTAHAVTFKQTLVQVLLISVAALSLALV